MPANLTAQYMNAEKRLKEAKTDAERLECLREMLKEIPKHKGTDKMQADLKRRISRMTDDLEKSGSQGKKGFSLRVKKEGAGQIALAGVPNTGKSRLVCAMTHARPEVADYPFTTQQPMPGMMNFKGVQVQLVDLPAVSEEHMEHWVMDNVRGADGVLVVIDLTAADPLEQVRETLKILENFHIKVYPANEDDDVERDWGSRPGMIVANKCDVEGAMEMLELIREMEELPLPAIPASAETGENLGKLEDAILDELKIIRIYSKVPHKDPDMDVPFAIKKGSTLMDFAVAVHKDVAKGLKSARVWGSTKFEGQTVPRDYILQDGDIVELHT